MKRKVALYVLLTAVLLYVASLLFGVGYIWKAIVYNYVDYDDYKIFDNRSIVAGQAQPWPDAKAKGSISLPEDLENYHREMGTIGFIAIKNDSIIFEKYWEDFDENTIANSFSVAKSYITMLVGFALQDGYFHSLNDKITDYLPDLDAEVYGDISLENLCTMSSGLAWTESYGGPINQTTEGYYGKDLWHLVANLHKENTAGSTYHYKGCDPQLLAFAIEKATGKTVSGYLSEKFWIPTGCVGDGLWSLDHKDGTEKAYCCINTTARNFAKIGRLYMQYGQWNGKQLLDSEWVAKSIKPNLIPNAAGEPTRYYGMQWWCMNDLNKNVFYARGLNGQYVICLPEKNMIVVRIGKKRESSGNHPPDVLRYVAWAETL
ncbi:serine hydrolase [bacterium]|nr:serine hydrolase [bacterium]